MKDEFKKCLMCNNELDYELAAHDKVIVVEHRSSVAIELIKQIELNDINQNQNYYFEDFFNYPNRDNADNLVSKNEDTYNEFNINKETTKTDENTTKFDSYEYCNKNHKLFLNNKIHK